MRLGRRPQEPPTAACGGRSWARSQIEEDGLAVTAQADVPAVPAGSGRIRPGDEGRGTAIGLRLPVARTAFRVPHLASLCGPVEQSCLADLRAHWDGGPEEHAGCYVGLARAVLPAKRAGMLAVHIRRGPWGVIQSAWPEAAAADLRVDSLAELVSALGPGTPTANVRA